MIQGFPRFAALATVLSASAWGGPEPVNSSFGPGEQMTYEVSYFGILAGTVQVTVGSEVTKDSTRVWPIVIVAQSSSFLTFYPVHDKFVTYWDPRAQRSLVNELVIDENHKRSFQLVRLNDQTHIASVTKQRAGESEIRLTQAIAPGALDMAAATYALRNHPLSVGAELQIPVFTGKKSFVLKALVESKGNLHTAAGDREAFKVRVQTEFTGKLRSKNDMHAYFSTDNRHVLLRVEAELLLGTVHGELIEFKPGQEIDSAALCP